MSKLQFLSLGWGVQSFTLLAMASVKEINLDYAIHSDTGFERSATYEFQRKWMPYFEKKGIKIITTENKVARDRFLTTNQVFIPAYTSNKGKLFRTCTERWKIAPIRRVMKQLRNKQPLDLLLGISTDEWQRMKPSGVKYVTNKYPLIDKKMSRKDCVDWLKTNGFDIPVKSSCVFCPFHSLEAWKEVRRSKPDWKTAVEIDELIRNKIEGCELFVSSQRKSLKELDENGIIFDYDNDECSGYCFL